MTRYLIALLALASTAHAQFPDLGAAEVHPLAQSRPAIVADYATLPGGTILQSFEVADLDAMDMDMLPALVATTSGQPEAQAILVRGLPDGATWADYRVFVDCTLRDYTDLYGAENLYETPLGQVTGQSYLMPALSLYSPIPHVVGGAGYGVHNHAITRAWNAGACGAFDGTYDLDGTSGTVAATSQLRTTVQTTELAGWWHRRYLADRDEVVLYFSTLLRSDFDGYPLGVRVGPDGAPLRRGDEIGASGGHAGMWPWCHEWQTRRWRFVVRYEPVEVL